MRLSRYDWYESHIADENIDIILKQLEQGNIYCLTKSEFWISPKTTDMRVLVGFYKEDENTYWHMVTNDDRRKVIKYIKMGAKTI